MGRIPDPNALRRDRKDDRSWTLLDSNGKVKQAPIWPLIEQSEREVDLWIYFWEMPQSILWERNSQEIEVALFVRRLCEVERVGATASLHTLLIRQMESLLLTIPSMYKARVKIGIESENSNARNRSDSTEGSSIRERMKLVPNLPKDGRDTVATNE